MDAHHVDKTYDPSRVEPRWYEYWLDQKLFHASTNHQGQPFSIVIPPPNITGSLHIGHALNNTLQDILIRWRRMQGRNALWVPGTDHAGIATQNVVERRLLAEGRSRMDLGREAFRARIWEWKEEYGDTILQQLRRLGASCDWSRLRFTMDDGLSRAVREVFVRLFEEGLLYRGERLVNWCPRCLTALSDVEVEHEDTRAKMYYIQYPLVGASDESLLVATTRPETLLGDTAVAVHPEDARYRHLARQGARVQLPLTSREIPIVEDSILVDLEFGTGAVKITPAHDFNDFEAGNRHGLERIALLDQYARFDSVGLGVGQVEKTLELSEKSVEDAREIVVDALRERGLLVKVDDHKMALGRCYRCKTVVEPYLSPQWFVKIQPLADPAIKAVEEGRIRMIPEGWVNNYLGWMRNIKDWCVSRQIWWGHRIPAWYCRACGRRNGTILETAHGVGATKEGGSLPGPSKESVSFTPDAQPIVARAEPDSCPACGGTDLIQDPDVLDTWFSSALWPFSTLGWPDDTEDLKTFYPTSTLVTGLDILFFWVARMIMMGLKFTGEVPFRDVYIHALVRDAEGQKMSKSKGNVIDPLNKMEQYGTDALRFTLAAMASPGRDIKLSEERIEGYRNFANKIWNAGRFIHLQMDGPREWAEPKKRSFADRWMLNRLNQTIRKVTTALEGYRFDQASSALYQFVWHSYCDWYLELIKPDLQNGNTPVARRTRQTLIESFEVLQRLLHPFMPFLTEEMWQGLPERQGNSIVVQTYPDPPPDWDGPELEDAFQAVERFVTTLRTGRSLLQYQPHQHITAFGWTEDRAQRQTLHDLIAPLQHLTRSTSRIVPFEEWPSQRILRLVVANLMVGLPVEAEADLTRVLGRMQKQEADKRKEISRLEGRLGAPEFTAKAPPEVIQETEGRLDRLRQEVALLSSSQQQIRDMIG